MKFATPAEERLAEIICNLKDQKRFIRISEALIRRIARRQEKAKLSQQQI